MWKLVMPKPNEPSETPLEDQPSAAPSRGSGLWWRAVVSALILIWLFARVKWQPILDALARTRLSWCFGALALYCLAQLVSSLRWQILAKALGFRDGYRRYAELYYVGMFFSLFLPTSVGGDVVKAWYLADRRGQTWLAALSIFSERFSGLLALLLIACFATLANPAALPAWAPWFVWCTTGAALVGLIALPILGRWNKKLRSLAEGLSFYRGYWTRWCGAMALSFLVQGASVIQIWMLGKGLGLTAPLLAYAVAVPVVSLLTMLPTSINGLGVRELSLVGLLVPMGTAETGAVALGLLWLFITGVASLIGGAVYLMGDFSRREGKDEHGSLSGDPDQGRAGQPAAAA
jgi:glycosyltransferase 2 family protein